jgi:AraC family transcriptional regulator, transcriptional activator of pobA
MSFGSPSLLLNTNFIFLPLIYIIILSPINEAMDSQIKTESLQEFYRRTNQPVPFDLGDEQSPVGHFNVRYAATTTRKSPYNRRDYYKVCLSEGRREGTSVLRYHNDEIVLDSPCLIFTNPSVPASIENSCNTINRYYCLFNNRFIEGIMRPDIQYSCALFNPTLHPVIKLSEEEQGRLRIYFEQMQQLLATDYSFKWEMIRNLLLLLIHEGIRLQQGKLLQPTVLNDRVVNGFFQLLNQQFPVISAEHSLKLLAPADFAQQLHVHVNHLNSVVKKHTGKTTRAIIHERVIAEAKTLLRHTDWNVSEIAYALGFEYPSHFNKYFRQDAGLSPMEFRANKSKALAYSL